MASRRRTFSDEQRATILARLINEPVQKVANELAISHSVLRRWMKKENASDRRTKKYSDEFKWAAINRVKTGERITNVSRDLKITTGMLSNWINGKSGAPGKERKNAAFKVGNGEDVGMKRRVHACVGLLKGIRAKANNEDPVHLTALLVLATLEGKM